MKKSERRTTLARLIVKNPFLTDEQLADMLGVSIATIRLDRAVLRIPEARERIRKVAEGSHDPVRSLEEREVVGEIVQLQLNREAVSVLKVLPSHVFERTGIMRGHVLFAQVNSLVTAVMDAEVAVTAKTELRFLRPVRLGETLWAHVNVVGIRSGVAKCRVSTESQGEIVLDGYVWASMGIPKGQPG